MLSRRPGAWTTLLAVALGAAALLEAALLELTRSYFTSGYNGVYLDTAPTILAFFLAGALLDAFPVLGLWAVLLPTLRWLRLSATQTFCLAGLVAFGVPFAFDVIRYQILSGLGERVGLSELWEISGHSSAEVAAQTTGYLLPLVLVAVMAVLVSVLILSAAQLLERRLGRFDALLAPPSPRTLWLGCLFAGVLGTGLLLNPSTGLEQIRYGLAARPSGVLLSQIIQRVTDVDRDGYGLLSKPPDPAPFDASIHPYALDVPGNGIDEDGLAGDLPLGFQPVAEARTRAAPGSATPHVLVVFLESFRRDVLGQRFRGRQITPFLDRLAHEGASSSNAYVHSPYTAQSRAQLFGGRLVPYPGQDTIIDDFKSRGYRVAHFSGQDDSWGGSEPLLGVERADFFYDARQDVERRSSVSASSGSLQVSWKLLNQRVLNFLASHDPKQPLFLYVNVVDTHFPYDHGELDDILGIDPIPRRKIRVDRARWVWETYLNTVANVDRAVEQLVTAWQTHLGPGPKILLVTADHGQSFYEDGFLGHGHSLGNAQSNVPFILWGIGGEWPEPLGLADVRDLLLRNLSSSGEPRQRARFVPDPERRVVQYMARIDEPHLLGLRALDRTILYDLRRERLELEGPGEQPRETSESERKEALDTLTWSWEALRWREEQEAASRGAARGAIPPGRFEAH